ncbi:MAG: hypothetical protein ACHQ1G_08155, partial [Planctomycetota bacterium]
PPASQPPPIDWSRTQAPGSDLEIHVPKAWKDNCVVREHDVHFGGPGAPGKRPELIFGWIASDWSLDAFARDVFGKFEHSGTHKVLGKGRAVVAGMPATYCVFETGMTRQVMYLFVGHGYKGFVRGIAQIDEFPKYGPVFEEAARRVRYNAQ